jgi:hypothetical protein
MRKGSVWVGKASIESQERGSEVKPWAGPITVGQHKPVRTRNSHMSSSPFSPARRSGEERTLARRESGSTQGQEGLEV